MSATAPRFSAVAAVVVVVGAYVDIVIIRVGLGEYPPLWAWCAVAAANVVAATVGTAAARRRAPR
jgi:hypothetical protein